MLQVKDVSYSIGGRQVLNSVDFSLMPGDKVALVGANGAGKSTLVKIIMGEISADEGAVLKPSRIGYVPQVITQEIVVQESGTVEEFMLEGRGLNALSSELHELTAQMEQGADSALARFSSVLEEFENRGGYEAQAEIEGLLHGLGLNVELNRVVSTLSGGEKTRLAFARSIFAEGDLLILDEPTNHIDRASYAWLGKYLKGLRKTILVVSHHPDFINPFSKRILEIEKFTGRIREYDGTYEDYLQQSAQNEEALRREVEWFDKEIARLTEIALRLQHGGVTKAAAAQNAFGRVERLQRQRDELIDELPRHEKPLRFKFHTAKRAGQEVLKVEGLKKSFGRLIFAGLNFTLGRHDRLVVLGPNGSGKSTLIRILVGEMKADEGTIQVGFNVSLGYYAQEHENLNPETTVVEEAESANAENRGNLRSVLGRFLFPKDKVFQKVGTLSQGEKSRLSLCKLLVSGCNLLVMDEPTNHLDPRSRDAVADAVRDFTGAVIFVSHDRNFVRRVEPNKVLHMPAGKIELFADDTLND